MKLTDLEPKFYRYKTEDGHKYLTPVELSEAQCVIFLCPVCFAKNGGAVGTHGIEVSFRDRGVQDDEGSHNKEGKPTRWAVSGTSSENLTLDPSILIEDGCAWHGHVVNGEIVP